MASSQPSVKCNRKSCTHIKWNKTHGTRCYITSKFNYFCNKFDYLHVMLACNEVKHKPMISTKRWNAITQSFEKNTFLWYNLEDLGRYFSITNFIQYVISHNYYQNFCNSVCSKSLTYSIIPIYNYKGPQLSKYGFLQFDVICLIPSIFHILHVCLLL